MQYRKFGGLDWRASALGFGAMRLPVVDGDYARIDEPEATRLLHYAIDRGVNYVDTAIHYHGHNSERFLGRALKDGYRERIRLATKLFPPYVETAADFDRLLNEQLEKLQTSHVDFYLLHGINRRWWPKIRDLGVLEWAERAIADGRVGYLGFSFHDDYPVFEEIVDAYDSWAMCQIQYNYMDIGMPCPNGVDIPYNLKLYNDGVMYEEQNPNRARGWYRFMGRKDAFQGDYHQVKGRAALCIQCGKCEEQCPQGIQIGEWMPVVHQVLGEGKSYDEVSLSSHEQESDANYPPDMEKIPLSRASPRSRRII